MKKAGRKEKQQNREEPGKLLFIQEVKTTKLKAFFRFVVPQWGQVLEKQQYPGSYGIFVVWQTTRMKV